MGAGGGLMVGRVGTSTIRIKPRERVHVQLIFTLCDEGRSQLVVSPTAVTASN